MTFSLPAITVRTTAVSPRPRSGFVASLLLAVIGLSTSVSEARNVALLIGVGQLRDPQLKSHQLLGPAADLDALQRTLTERWGFAPSDVRVLRDQEATHARVLEEISLLEAHSQPGDTVLVYFSGHGTSANDENNQFDLPYATGAWIPYDIDLTSLAAAQASLVIGRRDLVPRLKRLDEQGRWVVVVSDSCFSGQVVRSLGNTRAKLRYLPLTARDLGVSSVPAKPTARPPPPPYPYRRVLLLSGASDSEAGADISSPELLQQAPTLDGKYHGAFTDAFLRLLNGQLLAGAFDYAQAREALDAFLEHRSFAQHPQLLPAIAEDPNDLGSRSFLGMNGTATGNTASQALHDGINVQLSAVPSALRTRIAALSGVAVVEHDADLLVRANGEEVQLLGPAGDLILATSAADPALLRRISAQAWINRAMPRSTGDLGLRADTDPGSRGNTFIQCETFAFDVRLERPGYLMLLDLAPNGQLTVLYPELASEREALPAAQVRAIPGSDPRARIQVTPPFGTDQVVVLAFAQQPTFLVELMGPQPFAIDSSRADLLAKGLQSMRGAVSVLQIPVRTYPNSAQVGPMCSRQAAVTSRANPS